ncbi:MULTISPECIES: hypothetical protein [unclassified Streptomyces]|uniref:hypothetical protein n=1 Tax=unclassified Streptomyces TaxID=2593676 RepID=UPI002ED40920|nr:hypothetical protein [Streptomyces sp. BE230]
MKYGDDAFDTEMREPRYLPLGSSIAHLAERIRDATSSDEVADVLTELTASHDGVLGVLWPDLAHIRNDLADRQQDNPSAVRAPPRSDWRNAKPPPSAPARRLRRA